MKAVCLQIDGQKIFAEEGTTILEAARQNGIEIPTLCYHPRLAPLGHCRICIVAVEGINKPITSCDNPVAEGMVVTTNTPEIQEMRTQILTLSLSTHPYKDCLTCERTGTCELQENAYTYQVDLPEQLERSLPHGHDNNNPYIVRDEEKCILCGRCVQVCRSSAGCFVFEMVGNGVDTRIIASRDGQEVSMEEAGCFFCGQCVDVCPVAALTEKGKVASGREWQLSCVPGVCVECSVGCVLDRQYFSNDLVRVTVSREGDKASWLCKKGKFGVQETGQDTIEQPMILDGKNISKTDYDSAIKKAARALLDIKSSSGGDSIAILGDGKLSNEESYLLQKLAREVLGISNIDLGVENSWSRAYRELNLTTGPGVYGPTPASLQKAEAIFVIGSGFAESHPVVAMAIGQAARQGRAAIVKIAGEKEQTSAWNELKVSLKPGNEAEYFSALTAVLQGEDTEKAAKKVGITAPEIKKTVELLTAENSCIVVSPSFIEGADDQLINALVEMARTGGHIKPGRSRLLLLSKYGNEAGILLNGGSALYGPGFASLNGKSGATRQDIMGALEKGKFKGLLTFGSAFKDIKHSGLNLLISFCSASEDAPKDADLLFPLLPSMRCRGTFTSSSGYTLFNETVPMNGSSTREDWKVICELARALDAKWKYSSLEEIWAEMKEIYPG